MQIYSADLFTRAIQIHLGTSTELAQSGDTLNGDAQLSLTDAVGEQIDPLKAKAESMIASVDSVLISFQQLLNPKAVGDIDSSFTSMRGALGSLSRTAERLDQLVAVESITLTATLKNMETVSATLARNSDEMDHIFTNLDTLSSGTRPWALASSVGRARPDECRTEEGRREPQQRRRHHGQIAARRQPLQQPERTRAANWTCFWKTSA